MKLVAARETAKHIRAKMNVSCLQEKVVHTSHVTVLFFREGGEKAPKEKYF